jgi:hypothetical protein
VRNPEEQTYINYAAYGVLTNTTEMRRICPSAIKLGIGAVKGFKLDLRGAFPNAIEGDSEEYLDVVIWGLQSQQDLYAVANFEKKHPSVSTGICYVKSSEINVESIIFMAETSKILGMQIPPEDKSRIAEGYRENGFSTYNLMQSML